MILFIMAAMGWILDMTVLSQIGPAGRFPTLFATCYILGFGLMMLLVRICPRSWSLKQVAFAACLVGILGRAGFMAYPVGNDVYRYIWEGYIQNFGFNPYQLSPDDPALTPLIQGPMASIWPPINHKDLSAAYPPLTMLLFRLLSGISPTPIMFKTAMVGFDLCLLGLMIAIVRWRKVPPRRLFWYATNPLVLVYVAGEAHLDIVQATFLMGGLYALVRHRNFIGFMNLIAAALSKYFALVVFPFVTRRSDCKAWAAAVAISGVTILPFGNDPQALFRSLFIFGSQMHYNDGMFEIFRFLFGAAALPLMGILAVGILLFIYLFEHDKLRSIYLALGTVLVCLPTLHPWYLLLMAPLMVVYPSRAWLYLMLATIATLPVLSHELYTGTFQEIKWVKWVEYFPFFALLIHDAIVPKPRYAGQAFPNPRTISVIMPVLNEEKGIQSAIASVFSEPAISEIIVVDGGSQDETASKARDNGALVLSGPRGRGCQVNAGIPLSTGDVILILHADTKLMPGATNRMLEALNRAPQIAGGAFEMRFEPWPGLVLIEWLNNARARWLGIAFGDQGQFFRRAALKGMGGFPDMMLMEDVELSLRLKQFGRPMFIRPGVLVSTRRWVRHGLVGNLVRVFRLFLAYLVERRINGANGIRKDYYRKYYGPHQ